MVFKYVFRGLHDLQKAYPEAASSSLPLLLLVCVTLLGKLQPS